MAVAGAIGKEGGEVDFFFNVFIGVLCIIVLICIVGAAYRFIKRKQDFHAIKALHGPQSATKTALESKLNQFWQSERAKHLVDDTLLSHDQLAEVVKRDWRRIWDTLSYIAGEDWVKDQTGLKKRPEKYPWVLAALSACLPGILGDIASAIHRGDAWKQNTQVFPGELAAVRQFYINNIEHAAPKTPPESGVHGSAKFVTGDDLGPEYKSGGIPLGPGLYYGQDRHLLLIALSRTGKGRDVQVPALLEYPAPAIVIDPKGQLAAVTARRRREMGHRVYVINPFQNALRKECPNLDLPFDSFNPLATLQPDDELLIDDVRSLAEALIIDTGGDDSHWTSSARNLMTVFLMWVVRNEATVTLGKVRELITLPDDGRDGMTRKKLLQRMSNDDYPPIRNGVGRFLKATDEIENIFSGLDNQTAFLDSPNIQKCLGGDSGLRFENMKTKDITVYLVIPPRYLESHGRLLRLVIMSALYGLYSSPLPKGRLPVLFMLDEFPALGHLSLVEAAMGAAAGYGVQIWPCVQNLTQLQKTYKESWQTFVDNSGALQILGTNENTTAEYFSQKAGKKTVMVGGESETIGADGRPTMGSSTHETGVPLIEPLEFGRLGDDKQIAFLYGHGPIRWTRKPYFQNDRYKGLYDPDPYHQT